MTPADRTAAQAALAEGRGVYGRLDQIRGPEDAAADIMELWGAAESAMRAMLGGSTLSGQPLVRELRQRGILNLEQANALASFWDARSRVDDVGYKPTLTDVGYVRVGYNELSSVLSAAPSVATIAPPVSAPAPAASPAQPASPYAPRQPGTDPPVVRTGAAAPGVPPVVPPPIGGSRPAVRAANKSPMALIGLVVLALLVLGAAAYYKLGRSSYDSEMASATTAMQMGRTEAARTAFTTIARENPDKSSPHVFLSRLARDDGDMTTARQELVTAIRLDPNDERAQREMGVFLIAQNDPDLARSFLLRAVKLTPSDSAAIGYLGCALLRLNRVEEAQRFLTRAGQGTWSACSAQTPPATTPRAVR